MTQIWQSSDWPRFSYDPAATEAALAQAQEALGEMQGLQAGLGPTDLEEFRLREIVAEAVSSFGIEGVPLNRDEIEASVVASLRHRAGDLPGRRSDAIAALLLEARRAAQPLSAEMLQGWHRLLFFGIEVEDLGHWRSFELEIVRSAAAGVSDVLYKAPPPARLAQEMAVFLDWLNGEERQPVAIRAALAHLWFESIHPFSDGNGRIGRALIEHVFARARALPFSLSRQIEREKKAYYQALQAGRRQGQGAIDATAFVLWFLGCLTRAAEASRSEALFLLQRNAFFLAHSAALSDRQHKALRLLFAQGPERLAEGLSARSYRKLTGVSAATASRDLAQMEESGLLARGDAGGRSLSYRIRMPTEG